MTPQIQTLAAFALVAVAATWLVLRAFAKRKQPGCGGGCDCPAVETKSKLAKSGRTPAR